MRFPWPLCLAALALAAGASGRRLGRGVPTRIDYCSLCEPPGSHTMCVYPSAGAGANCTGYRASPLSDREKRAILRTHNVVRSRVANGLAWAKSSGFGAQPAAADMREMLWDRELEALAARWADQCLPFYTNTPHDDCRDTLRFPVGQNIVTTAYSKPSSSDVRARSLDWYGELLHFDPAWVRRFQPNPDPDPRKQIGHYTQMVWAWTYAVGCARVVFEEPMDERGPWTVERLVCNYAPSGNFIDYPVYTEGPPCSACPKGTVCSLRYPGLCAVLDVDDPEGEATTSEEEEHESGSAERRSQSALALFAWWSPAPRSGRSRPRPYIDVDGDVEGGGSPEEAHLDETQVLDDVLALEEGLERPENFTWDPTSEGVRPGASSEEASDTAEPAQDAGVSLQTDAYDVSEAYDTGVAHDTHDVPVDTAVEEEREEPSAHNVTSEENHFAADDSGPPETYDSSQADDMLTDNETPTADEARRTAPTPTEMAQQPVTVTALVSWPGDVTHANDALDDASYAPFSIDTLESLPVSAESSDDDLRVPPAYYFSYAYTYADSSL